MRIHKIGWLVLGTVVLSMPSAVFAQDPTGSCFFAGTPTLENPTAPEGEFDVALCVDNLTQLECESLTKGVGVWTEGTLCVDLDISFSWDGSCLVSTTPLGTLCVLLWTDPLSQNPPSEELCTNGEGQWSEDFSCGLPVPAMPTAMLALMAFVLLAGAMVVLTIGGSLSR